MFYCKAIWTTLKIDLCLKHYRSVVFICRSCIILLSLWEINSQDSQTVCDNQPYVFIVFQCLLQHILHTLMDKTATNLLFLFEDLPTSIADLMVANWVYWWHISPVSKQIFVTSSHNWWLQIFKYIVHYSNLHIKKTLSKDKDTFTQTNKPSKCELFKP